MIPAFGGFSSTLNLLFQVIIFILELVELVNESLAYIVRRSTNRIRATRVMASSWCPRFAPKSKRVSTAADYIVIAQDPITFSSHTSIRFNVLDGLAGLNDTKAKLLVALSIRMLRCQCENVSDFLSCTLWMTSPDYAWYLRV